MWQHVALDIGIKLEKGVDGVVLREPPSGLDCCGHTHLLQ
jgi:hypothetical protein